MLDAIYLTNIPAFLLILVRVTSFFVTLPLFSYRTVPTRHKIAFSFFLAVMMYFTVPTPSLPIDSEYFLLLLKEMGVGIAVGLLAYIILAAIQIAGGFIDFQMGFAIANVIDPQTGAQSPLIGQYLYMMTLLFILAVDGHHLMIDGVFYSYEWIAVDQFLPLRDERWIVFVIQSFNQMFVIAFLMAVPIVGCLFLVDIALGIIARTVPQLNVFVVGLPLKIFAALSVLVIAMAFYVMLIRNLFETMLMTMRELMQLFGG
ncbi:flagellar biosynthetic protein FliR [Halobacillus karajensis]|uniref:Flagellar biosynthetic protein FliR n=1 Tax=Halobacillus karajensis TaxID=195088 RepID=A0A024P1L1_9BACI|nr:flagellar biosynthetic protein FliR [Halobacillus karajensis]CDQ19729.1 Flagellar biosynthetic protein FliR [Halobacillus karajensis]CDQ22189.1 Flagellar biosynthetic protein FliR [Halobacillus karajensis]CDQ28030.1 Flagellar biosynthetic protein FliR [Halobacillus karajensis]